MKTKPIDQHEYDLVVETLHRYKRRWDHVAYVVRKHLVKATADKIMSEIMEADDGSTDTVHTK